MVRPDGFWVVAAVIFLTVRMVRFSRDAQEFRYIYSVRRRRIIIGKVRAENSWSPDREQGTERRWLGFVVSQVRKSGPGAPKFYVIDTMGHGPPAQLFRLFEDYNLFNRRM